MVCYSHLFQNFPQFVVIHTVKGFGIVNKAEIDVFLEFSCFFDDPVDVGNLISGSSAFSKTSLNIWKFTVHLLPKPGLENFKHHYTATAHRHGQEELLQAQGQGWRVREISLLPLLLSRSSRVRLCDPRDGSPPGSPIPGILQARTLEWVAISSSNA